jgi:hypothetical protein
VRNNSDCMGATRWPAWPLHGSQARSSSSDRCHNFANMQVILRYAYRYSLGKNTFSFDMVDTAWRESPPTVLPRDELFRPHPGKPNASSWPVKINNTIPLPKRRVSPEGFQDMHITTVFFDSFISSAPRMPPALRLWSSTELPNRHRCSEKTCERTIEDFVTSMSLYVPFINKFYTRLEKLVLHASEDLLEGRGKSHPPILADQNSSRNS